MIHSNQITISFVFRGKTETRTIDKMYISYADITDFYRILGKRLNFDIYKKDGVWCNVHTNGLSDELLKLVGNAIDEVDK